MNENTIVVTKMVRFNYVNLFKPASMNGSKPKYGVSVIIPKSDKVTIKAIKKSIEAAKAALENKKGAKAVDEEGFHNPLLDGDKKGDEAYKDSYFINAKSELKPKVFNCNKEEGVDETTIYSGCYGRASINFYGYSKVGRGVAAGIRGVKKYKDGEHLGGGANIEKDFDDDFDDEDDDFLA